MVRGGADGEHLSRDSVHDLKSYHHRPVHAASNRDDTMVGVMFGAGLLWNA